MNNWRCDNPHAFGDEVDRSYQPITSSVKVKCTGECFSWYRRNDLRAKIEPLRWRQYKPADFLAVRQLNWDETIDEDRDDVNWADPGAPNGGRSRPCAGNYNDDRKAGEDTHGGEKGTGIGKSTTDRKRRGNGEGQGNAIDDGKGKGNGNGKGKLITNISPGEIISLVPLLCSCRSKCVR